MVVNITSIKTSSDGVWQGEDPLHYAFPLLIVQTTLVLAVSRSLAFLFKPLHQPKVIAEICGGIILGPSALGRSKAYMHTIFPSWSTPILESVASIGLLFFLFLVGLELDLPSIRRSGRRAFFIAAAGISLPFICGIGVAMVLRRAVDGADRVGFPQYVVFMGVALSITAFPVLARILAEVKLLTTRVGETAMAAAAFNDLAAWILLALAIALAGSGGSGPHKSPVISVWVMLSGAAFMTFMMVVIRPAMGWVARRCSPEHDTMDEAYICLTLAGVMVSGFMTDLIGVHAIFGAFVFGLTIPKGEFAERLIERIEDFVSALLLPLYFASSGLKTDVAKIHSFKSWGLLGLVITTACAGKIIGTFVVAMICKIPPRDSITLGVLMNTKGLVELIVLNIGKEKKVLNDEVFAILVLMALFTTFMTTPTVMAIYKPARAISSKSHHHLQSVSSEPIKDKLRVLACVHGPGNISSLISLVELTRSTSTKSKLKLFILHLVELTERSSSIIMVQRLQKNGFPFISQLRRDELHDRVAVAFQAYGQLGRVKVRPITAISALSSMHQDICHVAEDKGTTMIILPFHKRWRSDCSGDHEVDNMGHGWRTVTQKVMKHAPCSVAVLVDRGLGSKSRQAPELTAKDVAQRVCVVFFGGPDDREALQLGGRMAEHPAVKVTVMRFVQKQGAASNYVIPRPLPDNSREKRYSFSTDNSREKRYSFSTAIMNREEEKELDERTITEFQAKWVDMVEYIEKAATNIIEAVLEIGRSNNYDLIVVGKGRFPSTMVAELAERQAEHAELGPIGDALASSGRGVVCSVLVLQQHDVAHTEETPVAKTLHHDDGPIAKGCSPSSSTEIAVDHV